MCRGMCGNIAHDDSACNQRNILCSDYIESMIHFQSPIIFDYLPAGYMPFQGVSRPYKVCNKQRLPKLFCGTCCYSSSLPAHLICLH